ncbi:MAG TPA: hypothetical protein VIZ00_04710 [Streptosporangiaceae bacterium]
MSYPPQQPEPEPGPYGGGQYPAGQYPAGPFPGNEYPPAGYAASGYQPGGYPPGGPQAGGPQAGRPGRPGILVSAVLLGILAVAALGIALALGHAASACSSDIGQIAQAFDQQAAGDCSAASTARTILEIAAPMLAIGCVAAIVGYRRR